MSALSRIAWPNALSGIVLAGLAYIYLSQPADLDYCWQIRTGERILATGQLQLPDTFSYTIHGRLVPDHEWLYEVLVALVWRGFDDAGLKFLRVVLFCAPLAILASQLRTRGVRTHVIVLAIIACSLVTNYFERLRPLVCSTIGLLLVAGWLHEHCWGRRRLDWRLPVAMLLWGNLHPAVIMGQGLLAGAILWEWISYYRNRPGADIGIPRGVTRWGGIGLLATAVAPDPVGRLLYPFAPELRHEAMRLFKEIQPPWHFLGQSPHLVDFAILVGIFYAIVLLLRRWELRGWEWALLAGVTILALTASRGLMDWFLVATALAVPQIGPLFRRVASRQHRVGRILLVVDRAVKKALHGSLLRPQPYWMMAWIAILGLASMMPISKYLRGRVGETWPTGVCDHIAANGMPSPAPWNIFCTSDDGAYLIWRFPGVARVHSDTRGFFYPGDYILDSYHLAEAAPDWRMRLQRVSDQGACYVLLRADNKLWPILSPHILEPLYRDEKNVLLTIEQVKAAARAVQDH